ncbi:TetR family transcriptional regulator [Streptomyces griseorubiginosus]|uniref:TetR/AcrR family transcriptional regulator n=1 Tax=Streptomyces griseorubiginosus TaxID=67304 RepID=UPI0036E3BD2E
MTPGARRALAAASRLFYERGIHAVGVDLIAAEAGVTKKTLYDRFGSKEQIVVEYLADRDERWRAYLLERLQQLAGAGSVERVRLVFDASRAWMDDNSPKGCGMVNAHAEISDPTHPAYAVITGQKQWMLRLFTDLAPAQAHALMLLHEGAMVAHGLRVFPAPIEYARDLAVELVEREGDGQQEGERE